MFSEHAQNLLGGEKRKWAIIELWGQKGSYCNEINYVLLIALYNNYIMFIKLLYNSYIIFIICILYIFYILCIIYIITKHNLFNLFLFYYSNFPFVPKFCYGPLPFLTS